MASLESTNRISSRGRRRREHDPEAAVAKAACTAFKALYPAQAASFDAELADSIASIPGHEGKSTSIAHVLLLSTSPY